MNTNNRNHEQGPQEALGAVKLLRDWHPNGHQKEKGRKRGAVVRSALWKSNNSLTPRCGTAFHGRYHPVWLVNLKGTQKVAYVRPRRTSQERKVEKNAENENTWEDVEQRSTVCGCVVMAPNKLKQ